MRLPFKLLEHVGVGLGTGISDVLRNYYIVLNGTTASTATTAFFGSLARVD